MWSTSQGNRIYLAAIYYQMSWYVYDQTQAVSEETRKLHKEVAQVSIVSTTPVSMPSTAKHIYISLWSMLYGTLTEELTTHTCWLYTLFRYPVEMDDWRITAHFMGQCWEIAVNGNSHSWQNCGQYTWSGILFFIRNFQKWGYLSSSVMVLLISRFHRSQNQEDRERVPLTITTSYQLGHFFLFIWALLIYAGQIFCARELHAPIRQHNNHSMKLVPQTHSWPL